MKYHTGKLIFAALFVSSCFVGCNGNNFYGFSSDKAQQDVTTGDTSCAPLKVSSDGQDIGDLLDDVNQHRQDCGKDKMVVICHIPPGNPANKHTIMVGAAAKAAHLAHGDTLGTCEGAHPDDSNSNADDDNSSADDDSNSGGDEGSGHHHCKKPPTPYPTPTPTPTPSSTPPPSDGGDDGGTDPCQDDGNPPPVIGV